MHKAWLERLFEALQDRMPYINWVTFEADFCLTRPAKCDLGQPFGRRLRLTDSDGDETAPSHANSAFYLSSVQNDSIVVEALP